MKSSPSPGDADPAARDQIFHAALDLSDHFCNPFLFRAIPLCPKGAAGSSVIESREILPFILEGLTSRANVACLLF